LKDEQDAFEAKLQAITKKYEDSKNAKDDLQFHFEEQIRALQEKQQNEVQAMKTDFESKLKEETGKVAKLQKEIAFIKAEHEEELEQQEEEYEYSIAATAGNFHRKSLQYHKKNQIG
jgi:hypothetical protein